MPRSLTDPAQRADVMEWIAGLETAERLVVLLGMSFAFPVLQFDKAWGKRIDECRAELAPTGEEMADILVRAGQTSGSVKEQLAG